MVGRQLCIAYSLKRSSSKCANLKWVWFLSKPFKGEILDEGQQWVLRLVGIFHEKECECVLKCISVSVGVNEWIYKYTTYIYIAKDRSCSSYLSCSK